MSFLSKPLHHTIMVCQENTLPLKALKFLPNYYIYFPYTFYKKWLVFFRPFSGFYEWCADWYVSFFSSALLALIKVCRRRYLFRLDKLCTRDVKGDKNASHALFPTWSTYQTILRYIQSQQIRPNLGSKNTNQTHVLS